MVTESIRISPGNKAWLESLKVYQRETIDDVLTRIAEEGYVPRKSKKPVAR